MNDTPKSFFSIKTLSGQVLIASVFYWLATIVLNLAGVGAEYSMLFVVGLSVVVLTAMMVLHVLSDIKSIRNSVLENHD